MGGDYSALLTSCIETGKRELEDRQVARGSLVRGSGDTNVVEEYDPSIINGRQDTGSYIASCWEDAKR